MKVKAGYLFSAYCSAAVLLTQATDSGLGLGLDAGRLGPDLGVSAAVDLTAPRTEFKHNFEECVGSGHMLLGTRADWRRHLKLAHDELGFKRIRGHGLLDDDMSVVAGPKQPRHRQQASDNEEAGEWPYQFYNVDQVFDYLLSIGMQPLVELSFMPSHFVECGFGKKVDCSYAFADHGGYKGLTMPPDDFNDWYDLVKALATHLVQRYTLEEVKSWNFEVWNEMWGVSFPDPYIALFNASSKGLKDVDASLRVGGPATMQTQFVPDFIKAATDAKIPFDFVSTHFYPTDPQCQTNVTRSHEDCFVDMVTAAQAAAGKAGYPFYLTEYNNGLGKTSRDDPSAAAFVFRMMGQVQSLDMFSWWTFSDVFEEDWMQSAPFHNGYGMMTVTGTRKPVWRAFQALHAAGNERYATVNPQSAERNSQISVLATTVSNQSDVQDGFPCAGSPTALNLGLYVASWHRVDAERFSCNATAQTCQVDPNGNFTDHNLCYANCKKGVEGTDASIPVTITIKHSSSVNVPSTARACRMDATHGNAIAAWQAIGSPSYPTAKQIDILDEASKLVEESLPLQRINSTHSSITVEMTEYSALYVVV